MRFAKRFRASFSGEFALACLDYKGLKKLSKKLGVGGEEGEIEEKSIFTRPEKRTFPSHPLTFSPPLPPSI